MEGKIKEHMREQKRVHQHQADMNVGERLLFCSGLVMAKHNDDDWEGKEETETCERIKCYGLHEKM